MKRLDSREVPLNLLDRFYAHSVGLMRVRQRSKPSHYGSGTLVRSNDRHFILTAAHCAEKFAKTDQIGLVMATFPNPFTIPVPDPIFVGERQSEEWGPDLAFLPIPPDKVAVINNYTNKIFWNLDRHQAEMLNAEPTFENGLWVLVGTPDVYSIVHDAYKQELKQNAYRLGSVGWRRTNGEFDYVHAPMLGKDMPLTFGGVSGGGLWRADIERNQDGSITSIGDARLEGCAFYEDPLRDRCLVIRCHGRRSIYEHGLGRLR